jgi:hypothetical protein
MTYNASVQSTYSIYLSCVNLPAILLAMKCPSACIIYGTNKGVFRQTGDHKRLRKALLKTNINTLICNIVKNNQTKQRYSFGFMSKCWHSWSNCNLWSKLWTELNLNLRAQDGLQI